VSEEGSGDSDSAAEEMAGIKSKSAKKKKSRSSGDEVWILYFQIINRK